MSIATMVRLAAQAEAGPPAPEPTPHRGPRPAGPVGPPPTPSIGGASISSTSNATSRGQAALEAIAGYIPSEALALYIGALGAFQPDTDLARWLLLGLGVVLVVLFAVFSALDRQTRPTTGKIGVVVLLAALSFVTYAAALPASPFLALTDKATVIAGFVAVVLSLFMPRIAKLANVAPPNAV